MKTNIGLAEKNLTTVKDIMAGILANAVLLYTKTRKFHWNVSGNSLMDLHKLFEDHYKKLEEAIDEIAERINNFGFKNPDITTKFLKITTLKEFPAKYPTQTEMLKELLKDHESVIGYLTKSINDCEEVYRDKGTVDFLTDLLNKHETLALTLRKYPQ